MNCIEADNKIGDFRLMQWINTEERTPTTYKKHNGNMSEDVLVYDGKKHYIARYLQNEKQWRDTSYNETIEPKYWCLIHPTPDTYEHGEALYIRQLHMSCI